MLAHCFGAAVAKLFTWHSYRSGLATVLHAAKVDDGMVQLICRWMCPESLHVYRRMGTSEHERLVRKAMSARVDLIQAPNVPKVMGDEGYAALVEEIAAPRGSEAQREYERALELALGKRPREAGEVELGTPSASPRRRASQRRPPASPARRHAHALPPASPTPPLAALPSRGVASLSHAFPDSLVGYIVDKDRPSARRPPTDRCANRDE